MRLLVFLVLAPLLGDAGRRRRYLTFPDGSSLQLVYCLTVPTLIPNTIVNVGWTTGVAWELPSDAKVFINNYTLPGVRPQPAEKIFRLVDKRQRILHRRHRRRIFQHAEDFLSALGHEGRPCVLRAICEASRRLPAEGSFVQQILHALFSLPSHSGDEYMHHYDEALNTNEDCEKRYSQCAKSVFEMVHFEQ